MDSKSYDEFTVEIHPRGDITATWVRHEGTALRVFGEVRGDRRQDIDLYTSKLRGGNMDELRRDDNERLGQSLYEAIFPDDIGELFERALAEITTDRRRGMKDLWLRVTVDADPQSSVYWWPLEFLNCKGTWLGAESYIALSRRVFRLAEDFEPQQPPLRVAVVLGGEVTADLLEEMAALAGEEEGRAGQKMDIRLLGLIQGYQEIPGIDYLGQEATYENLERLMAQGDWHPHVFHFVGNGQPEPIIREGKIGLVGEDGPDWCSAEDLASLLGRNKELRLVLLQGCKDAISGTEPGFMYVTENLAQRNIRAVVGMQFAISNDFAAKFAAGLYEALLRGQELDQAVQSGRRKIWYVGRGAKPHFGTPVLFTYNPQGIVTSQERPSPGPGVRSPVEPGRPVLGASQAIERAVYWLDKDKTQVGICIGAAQELLGGERPVVQDMLREALEFLEIGLFDAARQTMHNALRRLAQTGVSQPRAQFAGAPEGKRLEAIYGQAKQPAEPIGATGPSTSIV